MTPLSQFSDAVYQAALAQLRQDRPSDGYWESHIVAYQGETPIWSPKTWVHGPIAPPAAPAMSVPAEAVDDCLLCRAGIGAHIGPAAPAPAAEGR